MPISSKKLGWNPVVRAGWISTAKQREDAWKFCSNTAKLHYEERLERWNAELDMTLVFAGLFSTALTAFIVQSYPLLQPDNTDTIILALAHISSQLDSFSISPNFVNSTQRAIFTPSESLFTAPRSAVWINGLWFSSLICTLSTSSIAVLVRQWLRQYSRSLSGTSPDIARLRQYRYDSLVKWQVPEIIAGLPMLLQLAFALFLAGLLLMLWTLHPAIGILASVLVGLLFVFVFATSFLPVFYSDCCYQSPHALSLFLLAQANIHFFSKVLRIVERQAHEYALRSSSWTSHKYTALMRIRDTARASLRRLNAWGSSRSWHAREKPNVDKKHSELEQSLALTAYYITLDRSMLNTTIIPCLSGMDALSARMSVRYGALLLDIVEKLPSREWRLWRPIMLFVVIVLALITKEPGKGTVRKVLQAMPRHPQSLARSKLGQLYLLAMSQLVVRRIAPREAFEKMLIYLKYARLDSEGSAELGTAVLEDVEASFPVEKDELELLVNLDRAESISYYLTGMEYAIKYLLLHRTWLERDGSSVPERIRSVLFGFGRFLCASAWQKQRSRREAVLWALASSQLPALLVQMKRDASTPELVEDEVDKVTEAMKAAVSVLKAGYLASSGTIGQQAFILINTAMRDLEDAVHPSGVSPVVDGSDQGKNRPIESELPQATGPISNGAKIPYETGDNNKVEAVNRTNAETRYATLNEQPPDATPSAMVSIADISGISNDDTSEITNPWQDLLNDIDMDVTVQGLLGVDSTSPLEQELEDVPDSALPDPHMWPPEYRSYSASSSEMKIIRSHSFSAAAEEMLREDHACPPELIPSPREPQRDQGLPGLPWGATVGNGEVLLPG